MLAKILSAMSVIVIAWTFALSTSPALSKPLPYAWNPPARYDHVVTTQRWNVYYESILKLTFGRCWGTCHAISYSDGRTCTTIIPKVGGVGMWKVNREGQKALIRHERGHCNGWPANHPP